MTQSLLSISVTQLKKSIRDCKPRDGGSKENSGIKLSRLKIYSGDLITVFYEKLHSIFCLTSIFLLPCDTPSIQLSGILEDQKVDRIESRLRIRLKKYIKTHSLLHSYTIILMFLLKAQEVLNLRPSFVKSQMSYSNFFSDYAAEEN
ncbi:hypothetical protein BpHYR1_051182 [Brachionus plicatilis]|uniref:Uncharacterized protein n=1 Tax=Brachionus plicatilis TaxID=10195 RepID=A0A3M7QQY0_BRAPC|nr:hypothetical protein BpHYR1_051182 [Brachionus plicatilis]